MRNSLPVDDVVPDIIEALRRHTAVVVQAPTGAGKTTRVPPALALSRLAEPKPIVVIEPRRIAARAAARRIAAERNEPVGQSVGYHVRFDRCATHATRLLYVTPGILLQHLHDDLYLDRFGLVVFDEIHERGLEGDLAIGFVRLIQQTVRPDFRLVAMSATVAARQWSEYLEHCPIIECSGRLHPVDIQYQPKQSTMDWPAATAQAIHRAIKATSGDILAFLPGWSEIRRTAREMEAFASRLNLDVRPLHGDLGPGDQDAALLPSDRRKVVLATNVAETSVTVEGVTAVVDTGLARELRFDPAVGLDRLEVVPISQASADQRTGRAGRTQSGLCIRLWSESNHRSRPAHTAPEVSRIDIAAAILQLLAAGESEPARFPWPEAPSAAAIKRGISLLTWLGAVDAGRITDCGRTMARLPVHPRLARLVVEGLQYGHMNYVCLAAALLAERDPFRRRQPKGAAPSDSDVVDRINAIEEFARTGSFETSLGEIDGTAARYIIRVSEQIARSLPAKPTSDGATWAESVGRSLLAAFPDRVCRRRNPGGRKGVMVGGRGVRLDDRSAVTRPLYFLALDVDAGQQESLVRLAAGIEREWIPETQIQTTVETEFDDRLGKPISRKRTRYLDLLLEDVETQSVQGQALTDALIDAAIRQSERIWPQPDTSAGKFRTRVECLRTWLPKLGLSSLELSNLEQLLSWLAPGCASLAELAEADWLAAFRGRFSADQLRIIDREAPERITLPNGRSAELHYELGKPPVLAARIQELFGWTQTPNIAAETVPVLLHLLAPNNRPQQVTHDLASFWKNTYPVVRKELRGRYPKHAWPEDPLLAVATPRLQRNR